MRAVVAFALAVLAARTARADEPTALAHLERGIAAFEAGALERAHAELARAAALAPHKPNPYRWLALVEVQLGECASATRNIAAFRARVAVDDPRLPELERVRDLCERTGVLRVTSTPAAATLRIDGAAVGATPYRAAALRAGTYTLVAEKPGFAPATRSVVVTGGAEHEVELRLAPAHAPITRRRWFWPVVAGAAAAVAGVVVYAAVTPRTTLLPPIQCDPGGCAPGDP